MRHPSETFFEPITLDAYEGHDYAGLQRRIARSNRFPLKPLALTAGLLNGVVLGCFALMLSLLGKARPDSYDRELGRLYFHVSEMAVHKRIELDVLTRLARKLFGRGIDLGCGNGYVGGILKRMTSIKELHGVDPVSGFANDVVQNGYSGFTCATAGEIPLESGSFDFVVSICVVEHIRDLDGTLREALRLLKDGGALVLTTPSPEFRLNAMNARLWAELGFQRRAEAAARRRDKISMQFHYATADEWRKNLEAIGFDSVELIPFFSKRQLLAYELMNWSARLPELYFPDKLWVLCQMVRPIMHKLAWSTAVIGSWIARWNVPEGCHTHWLVSARRPVVAKRPAD